MFSRACFFTGEKDHTGLGALKLIGFGSGPSPSVPQPADHGFELKPGFTYQSRGQSCQLGCRGMHIIRMVLPLPQASSTIEHGDQASPPIEFAGPVSPA
jgi:hypothetical protein